VPGDQQHIRRPVQQPRERDLHRLSRVRPQPATGGAG
jgi:hypothetical protein